MKNTRLIKAVLTVISIFTLYRLFWTKESHSNDDTQRDNSAKDLENNLLATHHSMPSKLRGKKLAFHQVYEPRQIGQPSDLEYQTPKHFNKTKVILLWTSWNGIKRTINYYFLQLGNKSFVKYRCPTAECVTTRNRKNIKKADAVLFHLLDTKSSDLPSYRNAQQVWILYNMEPPWQIKKHRYQELANLKNIFNWTMSYRRDSDILARYGFIAPSSKSTNMDVHNKTKNVVWFVSDCTTDSKREDYVKELKKYIDVDIYGTCGDKKCFPSQSDVCYEKVLEKYKFYLSFENAICKDYVTEKFFNVFNYDIIPVVFGASNYTSIAPAGTIIDATQYPSPEELAKVLHKISNNDNLYKKYILKKRSFKAYLDPWMCRLCLKLHTIKYSSTLENVEQWWLNEGKCQTWNKTTQQFLYTA